MSTASSTNISGASYAIISDVPNTTKPDTVTDSECLTLNLSAIQFHDESKDVVSAEVSNLFINVLHGVLLPALFFIGFPSNIINMAVFYQHGLKHRINLCLFSLSLVDLILVTFAFLVFVEKLGGKDLTTTYRDVGYLPQMFVKARVYGLYSGSASASQFVSAVIAGERCICIMWPLKASAVLKTKTIGVLLLLGILPIYAGRIVVALRYHVVCIVDVMTEQPLLFVTSSEFYRVHSHLVNVLESFVYGLGLAVALCIFIIITTFITALNLRKSTEFQKESSTAGLSARNVAVTRMLVYLSLQFIVLSSPNTLIRATLFFLPQLSTTGHWANLYFCLMTVTELCSILNSTFNFLVYYFFGSKYRKSLQEMFCCKSRKRASGKDPSSKRTSGKDPSGVGGC
ncbi:hypothetical protein ACOMHN_013637 [Nucella lapillus]